MIIFTNRQARQFMLLKHGLIGAHKFIGNKGALDFVLQAGCIQYDPVDLCGKNAELTLQSRVKGFTKKTLDDLLYIDRALVDYPDKNLSIMHIEDWPYFERYRQAGRQNAEKYDVMNDAVKQAREFIEANGAVCSDDLKLTGEINWWSAIHWSSGSNLSRAVLEQMYTTGELVIHHKKGARKYYDLSEKYIPTNLLNAPEPIPDDFEYQKWRVLRRIGAVGLMWNRPSDAWLNIWGLKTEARTKIFRQLLDEGKIFEIAVEGFKSTLYIRSCDLDIAESVLQNDTFKPRCELIAPLDCFMWDRKLIKALFGFEYAWEIYTPRDKRKYGVYVLPLLYGENFIGRVEAVVLRKTKTLTVKNIWYEDGVKPTKKLQTVISGCFERFASFSGCDNLQKNLSGS